MQDVGFGECTQCLDVFVSAFAQCVNRFSLADRGSEVGIEILSQQAKFIEQRRTIRGLWYFVFLGRFDGKRF
ncbi:hypothetical protein AS188_11550 [Kocuria flava]|uniref:Uncharacterized protein n=1 Tax=Kocuria flava TaxID=446860 RepID=A0A0U2P0G6_9MICC|nr:hypothetical protein AS188_11550 [Kocuria flava]